MYGRARCESKPFYVFQAISHALIQSRLVLLAIRIMAHGIFSHPSLED